MSTASRRAALVALLLSAGCQREPEPPGSRPALLGASAARLLDRPPPPPRPSSSEALRTLAEIRERSLSLAAPPASHRRLAFGRGFFVQLAKVSVSLRRSQDGSELSSAPIAAFAATPLAGGNVLVVGLEASYRFEPGQQEPRRVARVSLLPGAELHPVRESIDEVWLLNAPLRTLLRYALQPDAGVGVESERVLAGYDGSAFTTLLDGTLLFTAEGGLARATRGGGQRIVRLPPQLGRVWRLLAADRVDRAWAVTDDGRLVLLALSGRASIVRSVETGVRPFDVAATAKHVALVSVDESGQRSFALHVYTADGSLRFRAPLPAQQATADSDWVARVAGDKQVAVSEEPPRVAVGGPSRLLLFDLLTGRLCGPE